MALRIHLLRHGQTEFSRENNFCGSGMDPELTSDGERMAEAFASAYRDHPWRAVYCSPLRRTIATARPLCHLTGIDPELRDGLKEIAYGKWEGKTVEEVAAAFHDDYIRWVADPAWYAPNDGELAVTIAARCLPVIEEIRQRFSDGEVLVVSHKATIRILLCSLLGIDVGRFRYRISCPVGSASVVEFTAHGPQLVSLADRTHLSPELRNLPGT